MRSSFNIKEGNDFTPVISRTPMAHLQMDLIDMSKFQTENNGYNWILTIIDVFSKYLWTIPLFTKDQVSVSNALLQLFAIVGTPEVLQTDNGKEFNNGVIKSICQMLKVSPISNSRDQFPIWISFLFRNGFLLFFFM